MRSVVELIILPDLFGKRPAAYIHKVYTEDSYQGRGIATSLVKEAISYAKEHGCYKVFLVCRGETVSFYRRLGLHEDKVGMVKML